MAIVSIGCRASVDRLPIECRSHVDLVSIENPATAPATRLFAIIIIIMLVVVVRNEDNHHDGHRRRGPPGTPKRLKRPKSGIIGSGRSARLRAHPQNRVESGKIGFLRVKSGIIGSGRCARLRALRGPLGRPSALKGPRVGL